MPRRIDAHHHLWRPARGDYGWLTPDLPIHRDYEPADMAPLLAAAGIDATILVQAAPTEAETRFLLDHQAQTDWIVGVVGWCALDAPDAPDRVAALAEAPGLVGLRPMIQDLPDDDWMLDPAVSHGLTAMERAGLAFDALTLPRHLPHLRRLLDRHPDLRVVIDHASKAPVTSAGPPETWRRDMAALASETGAFCKLSGMVTEAPDGWTTDMLQPYVDHLLETFGPARLIWGSDWPVSTLAATYEEWVAATETLLSGLSENDRTAVMGGNAEAFYGL